MDDIEITINIKVLGADPVQIAEILKDAIARTDAVVNIIVTTPEGEG